MTMLLVSTAYEYAVSGPPFLGGGRVYDLGLLSLTVFMISNGAVSIWAFWREYSAGSVSNIGASVGAPEWDENILAPVVYGSDLVSLVLSNTALGTVKLTCRKCTS